MNQINIGYYKKNGLELIIGVFEGKLCLLDHKYRKNRETIDNRIQMRLKAKFVEMEDPLMVEVKKQIDEYFKKKRKEFTIPLLLIGSEFQKKVWNTLLEISYGEIKSYKEQAKMLGDEKAVRAVANANGANAISIIVPCHRVIGTNGKLTGYAGGVEIKQRLLELERE